MEKTITPITLADLAFYFNFELSSETQKVVEVYKLDSNFANAGPASLTYVEKETPGELYRCKAAAVLVPHKMKKLPTLDEGVVVIAVDNPTATFEKIFKSLN